MEIIDIQLRGVFARIEEKGNIELSDLLRTILPKRVLTQFVRVLCNAPYKSTFEDPIADEILEDVPKSATPL